MSGVITEIFFFSIVNLLCNKDRKKKGSKVRGEMIEVKEREEKCVRIVYENVFKLFLPFRLLYVFFLP